MVKKTAAKLNSQNQVTNGKKIDIKAEIRKLNQVAFPELDAAMPIKA